MHLTHALHRRAIVTVKPVAERQVRTAAKPPATQTSSGHALAEISAYVAIRDSLLEKAEANRTESILDRLEAANEFVQNCFRPTRSPYEGQYLAEAEAVRERTRCEAVKARLARLRNTLANAA